VATNERRDLLRRPQTLLLTVIAATVLAACSSGKDSASSGSPSPSVTPSPAVEAQVIAAWRAEHVAYADALRSLNPNASELAQTAIDPALRRSIAYIAATKAQGIVVRGSEDLGSPKVVSLTPQTDPREAVVESCVHGGLVLINPKSNKPVPGLAGQVTWNFEHTTLRLVEGVGWVVADNVVRQDTKESVCGGH